MTAYLGSHPANTQTPARLHYATRDRKLAPVYQTPYDGPGRRRFRPEPIGPYCSATYASIAATCPASCRFKGAGCYVTEGFTAKANRKLDTAAHGLTHLDVIEIEARLIETAFKLNGYRVPQDGARGGRDLRLHIGGDARTTAAAYRLGRSALSWGIRGGGDVWTFTHAWKDVYRAAWGPISVLASVESAADANRATLRGYAPAIVVPEFPSDRAFTLPGSPTKWIPCPAETRGKTCVECRLCLDAPALSKRGTGIAFAIHGRGADKVKLPVIRSTETRVSA